MGSEKLLQYFQPSKGRAAEQNGTKAKIGPGRVSSFELAGDTQRPLELTSPVRLIGR